MANKIDAHHHLWQDEFAADPGLKGVRHVLHDEVDDFYMLRDDFNRGVSLLAEYGLAYDLLVFVSEDEQARIWGGTAMDAYRL
jgi:L-fuconolactonase